jgi:hypothetical protein
VFDAQARNAMIRIEEPQRVRVHASAQAISENDKNCESEVEEALLAVPRCFMLPHIIIVTMAVTSLD